MDAMASFLSYQQNIEELQYSLLSTTMELKSLQLTVKEEKRRNEENIKQLLQLLQAAFQERDEAKDHLQRLLNKITQSGVYQLCYAPNAKPESSPVVPAKGKSSVGKSDCLSETYNHDSYVSSPVDSLLDAVSPSPDLSNINVSDSTNIEVLQKPSIQEYSAPASVGLSPEWAEVDPASAIIDQLVTRKTLPEKGKLLQAVMDSGPLLQTLLLAGPLPQWRNPPPPQPLQIPPISIKSHDPATLLQKPIVDPNYHVQSPPIAPYQDNSEVKTQNCSTSFFNFSNAVGSCVKKQLVSSSVTGNHFSHNPSLNLNMKRRKVK